MAKRRCANAMPCIGINPNTEIVRAAVGNALGHGSCQVRHFLYIMLTEKTCYAAHIAYLS